MRSLFVAALVLLVVLVAVTLVVAQTPTPQTGTCVEKAFQETTHLDITVGDAGIARGMFTMRLPSPAVTVEQIAVRLGSSTMASGFVLLNLTASIRLNNVAIEHGISVPINPFLQSFSLPSTLSQTVIFHADPGSSMVVQADFKARPQDLAGVDVSIVGVTRTDSCVITL